MLDLARPVVLMFRGKVGLVFFSVNYGFLGESFLLMTKQTTNDSLLPVRQRVTGSTRC